MRFAEVAGCTLCKYLAPRWAGGVQEVACRIWSMGYIIGTIAQKYFVAYRHVGPGGYILKDGQFSEYNPRGNQILIQS